MWQNRGKSSAVPSGFYDSATATPSESGGRLPRNTATATSSSSFVRQQRRYQNHIQSTGYHPYGASPPPAPPVPSPYHQFSTVNGTSDAGATLAYPHLYPHAQSPTQVRAQVQPHAESRKRPREDSSPRPRCEPCDLEFDSLSALEAHRKSHVKCSSCAFEGAPKVVKGHFQAVHGKFSGSGFKTITVQIPGCPVQRFRICVGNRPEDVQKWIQERKKKFPRSRPATATAIPSSTATTTNNNNNPPNEGLSSLLQGYSSSEEETEETDMGRQGTTDDSTGNHQTPPVAPSSTHTVASPNPCHSFVKYGRCRRGNACPYSHDPSLRTTNHQRNGAMASTTTTSHRHRGTTVPTKRTLLNTLLETDADRETKFALQLIHYMVHTNFLQTHDGGET